MYIGQKPKLLELAALTLELVIDDPKVVAIVERVSVPISGALIPWLQKFPGGSIRCMHGCYRGQM